MIDELTIIIIKRTIIIMGNVDHSQTSQNVWSISDNKNYYMADWFRVLWLVNSRSVRSRTGPLVVDHFFKTGIINKAI